MEKNEPNLLGSFLNQWPSLDHDTECRNKSINYRYLRYVLKEVCQYFAIAYDYHFAQRCKYATI